MRRVCSLFIAFVLLVVPVHVFAGTSYSSEISSVMTSFTLNNISCKSAVQQAVNGNYRTVEMLEIIAKELDTKGTYSSSISSVMTSFTLNNISCKSAPQQEVNGTYRTVEMLEIIAKELDN